MELGLKGVNRRLCVSWLSVAQGTAWPVDISQDRDILTVRIE